MEQREVLNELIENLYFSVSGIDKKGALTIAVPSKFARAYAIAEQLYEYETVNEQEVEAFVAKVKRVTV